MRFHWDVIGVFVVALVGALTIMLSGTLQDAIGHLLTWSVPVGVALVIASAYVFWRTFGPSKIPLYEAVRIAYEGNLRTYGALAADIQQHSPDGIAVWFAYALAPKVTIYGSRPPSRVCEIYSDHAHRNDYDLSVEMDEIVARQRPSFGTGRWENMFVRRGELGRALKDIRRQAKLSNIWSA